MTKVIVFHFHNGSGGGVLSVIRNLLFYCQDVGIENHIIYTINKDKTSFFQVPELQGATTEQVFYYSSKWNFYYTCKQLNKLLPDKKVVIVAHDWLELGMVSNLGLQNPVVQVLHGDFDYYYDLAKLHAQSIDSHICVSNIIKNKLKYKAPFLSDKVNFLPFPVPEAESFIKETKKVKCAFFVRDITDERKQAYLLPLIDQLLQKKGLSIEWHIAGECNIPGKFEQFWPQYDHNRVFFYGFLDTEGIRKLLKKCTVFILPSLEEGFPVSVVEAMKYGLVPLVSKWEGAVDELIEDGSNGFFLPTKNYEAYANCINYLANNPDKLDSLGRMAKQSADFLFNPHNNTKKYEDEFLKIGNVIHKRKKSFKAYGSRLDTKYFPNWLVKSLRF